ncbi:MAG: Dyp-type peroxidase [Sphingobacteriaceae bacterium]|nr:Dyp-type peroxidase [Sphingobacteriaceae bacterium]
MFLKNLFKRTAEKIELQDIQAIILRDRPLPYHGVNVFLEVLNTASGKAFLKEIVPYVTNAKNWWNNDDAWLAIAFTYEGLKKLGLPYSTMESFPDAFKKGMAARSEKLMDINENAPEKWDAVFKATGNHIAVSIFAKDIDDLSSKKALALQVLEKHQGVKLRFQADFDTPIEGNFNHFGFRDGISNPEIEGSGAVQLNSKERPIKAGEFLLGYANEAGNNYHMPQPLEFAKNGTFVIFRKYHSHVAAFNKYLNEQAKSKDEQELLGAKMVGRWRSGAPLNMCPFKDNAALGADARRNNDFDFSNDQNGKIVPYSSHMRRMNPRDSKMAVMSDVNLHRIIRKGVGYGPVLPNGSTKDDGKERGLYFIAFSAKAMETLEFLQKEWVNNGNFVSLKNERDPIIGLNEGKGTFTMPGNPLPRRYIGMPTFNTLKGGMYLFMPGIRAIKWMSEV